MEAKKISFGFSKVIKKPNLLPNKSLVKEENKKELIKCVEGQEIKLVAEKKEVGPLIIPLTESQKTPAALASLMKRRAVLLGEEVKQTEATSENGPQKGEEDAPVNNNAISDLDQRAAIEILSELKQTNETTNGENLILPAITADELPLDGAKEPTIDDYEAIPVQQFGFAMLRGMGWKEPTPEKGKNNLAADDMPFVRPKGMGLGADKALKPKPLLVAPEPNEVLEIKKQAYVRILGGKHKDAYGQIEGFDDEGCRIIVKMAIGGAKEAFNEFLCQPVSKKEYAQYGKCINSSKYEKYKKMENDQGQIVREHEVKKEDKKEYRVQEDKYLEKERSHRRRDTCEIDNRRHRDAREDVYERRARDDYGRSSRRRECSPVDRRSSRRSSRSRSPANYVRERRGSTDSSESSKSDSDSDSAYERSKHKKKKSHSESKKKTKKSKTKKSKHKKASGTADSDSDASYGHDSSSSKRPSKHKKKTKKSKKQRSRS